MNKPPIGIMPHKLWLEHRINSLQEAIARYNFAGKIGDEQLILFIQEYLELNEVYQKKFKK